MKDLLQQAMAGLTPNQRADVNLNFAVLQNIRNLRHQDYCDLPSNDLIYALHRLSQYEARSVAQDFDRSETMVGLS